MYTGQHHRSTILNIDRLRSALPGICFDLAIVSAGYGLLEEETPIIPYEATFRGLTPKKAIYQARELDIHNKLKDRLGVVDVGIFLLGKSYLDAIEAPIARAPLEVYVGAVTRIPDRENVACVRAGRVEARLLGVAPRMVGAMVFQHFVDSVLQIGWVDALDKLVHGEIIVSNVRPKAPAGPMTG